MSLLEVQRLSVVYPGPGGQPLRAVHQASLSLEAGETLALVGESGSGKTTLAMALFGLLSPGGRIVEGDVRLDGASIRSMPASCVRALRGDVVGYVFQNPMTSLNPVYSVGRQLTDVIRKHQGVRRTAARTIAVEALERVGIGDAASRMRAYPHELSGGMQQRVLMAMATSCHPRLLIADEPTTALDVLVQKQVMGTLASLRDEFGLALLLVTHDLALVGETADRVAVMQHGEIVEQGAVADVFERPGHDYTIGLLDSVYSTRIPQG